ncbi:MAG: phosphoserine phosphatase SerB [Myxococcota bacterium]
MSSLDTSPWVVTIMGDDLDQAPWAEELKRHGADELELRELRRGKPTVVEGRCSLAEPMDTAALRAALQRRLPDADVAIQRDHVFRQRKRLVVFDMDSTLIQVEVIDELARLHGIEEQVSDITRRAMEGELDYEASLHERVALLRGLDSLTAQNIATRLPLSEGAAATVRALKRLGIKTAVVSGGFTFAAHVLRERLGLDYAFANELEVVAHRLTGRVMGEVVTPQRKASLLRVMAQVDGLSLDQVCAVGDGANDLMMLAAAGLGVAFHGKPTVAAAADTSIGSGSLLQLLYLFGLSQREIDELLAD